MKNMKSFYQITLEVTRRCNLCCAHCLRGQAQTQDMTTEIIDQVLDLIEESNSFPMVSFTGGEPTLRVDLIKYFFDKAKERGIAIEAFWLATNGYDQVGLLPVIASAYAYVDDKELCGVALSVDEFHDEVEENLLKAFSFYDSSKETDWDTAKLIDKGFAFENGIGERDEGEYFLEFTADGEYIEEMVYITANGLVTSECDLTYEEMDEEGISLSDFRAYLESEVELYSEFKEFAGVTKINKI